MSIVIGGGTGFIGRHFFNQSIGKRYKIISVSRKPGQNHMTWNDLARVGLPKDCCAVISMSGEKILQPFKKWTPEMKKIIRESRVDKTKLLNDAICQAKKKPKVFISLSGVSYYKPDKAKEYTEDDIVPPYDFLSELTRDWENAAKLPDSVSTRSVIIRTGVVMGKDGGMIENIKLPFSLGLGGPIGSGKQWLPWIHARDLAGILWHGVENDDVTGVLNGTSPNPVSSGEFTKAYASALNRPHLFPLPGFVVNTVFGSEAAVVMMEGQKVMPKRTLESGFTYKYPDVASACKQLAS